jgi:transketolase
MAEAMATRAAYGQALARLADKYPNLMVMDADLSKSTMTVDFKKVASERFINAGIAENNMICMGGGLAASGKVVFTSSFAVFTAGRSYEQILNTLCVSQLNVKVAATHAGLTVGEDGMSHQMVTDMALMRTLPGMRVMVPADGLETAAMVEEAINTPGPVYLRLGRSKVPALFEDGTVFEPGRINVLHEGDHVTIAACGIMVAKALEAAQMLAEQGIFARVLNVSTIKPLDQETLLAAAEETGAIVTCEEHSIIGGLGGAVSELVAEHCPVPVLRLGVKDTFGQSGKPDELLEHYGLTAGAIAALALQAMQHKKRC